MDVLNLIRAVVWTSLWIMLTGLSGCPLDIDKPSRIPDLVYIPRQVPEDAGKTTAVIGTFDIIQESGEIMSINTEAFDAQGKKVSIGVCPLSDATLKTSAPLGFACK